jgi:hypothetical protein
LLGMGRDGKRQRRSENNEAAGRVNPHGSRYNRAGLLGSVVFGHGGGAVSELAVNGELPKGWILRRSSGLNQSGDSDLYLAVTLNHLTH